MPETNLVKLCNFSDSPEKRMKIETNKINQTTGKKNVHSRKYDDLLTANTSIEVK